jgi:hypothetical protein
MVAKASAHWMQWCAVLLEVRQLEDEALKIPVNQLASEVTLLELPAQWLEGSARNGNRHLL